MLLFNPDLLASDEPNRQAVNQLLNWATAKVDEFDLRLWRLFFRWFYNGGTGSLSLQVIVETADLYYPAWWPFHQGLFRRLILRRSVNDSRNVTYFLDGVQVDQHA